MAHTVGEQNRACGAWRGSFQRSCEWEAPSSGGADVAAGAESCGWALPPPPGAGPGPTATSSPARSLLPEGHLELTATCNAQCACGPEQYSPVCGSDGLTYYSPCHAGCHGEAAPGTGGQKVSAAAALVPCAHCTGGPPSLPPVISAVVAPLRCTETVAVSLRIFPLVLAMLPQGNALQLVKESPSFWFSYSL